MTRFQGIFLHFKFKIWIRILFYFYFIYFILILFWFWSHAWTIYLGLYMLKCPHIKIESRVPPPSIHGARSLSRGRTFPPDLFIFMFCSKYYVCYTVYIMLAILCCLYSIQSQRVRKRVRWLLPFIGPQGCENRIQ